MFIIIVFDYVLTRSYVSKQDFYCSLPRDQSRDVTSRLGVSVILHSVLHFAFTHFFSGYYYYDCVVGVLGALRTDG